jgi:hypothetical protein
MLSHPDLQGQFVAGYDFVSDPANAGDGDGIDPDPTDPGGDGGVLGGGRFHGTHIAGTVAAITHNAEGVAGVAFGAQIMPLRVMNKRAAPTTISIREFASPPASPMIPALCHRAAPMRSISVWGDPISRQPPQPAYNRRARRAWSSSPPLVTRPDANLFIRPPTPVYFR